VGARQAEIDAYHAFIFIKHLIIFTQTDEEHKGSDVFETMDPFLSLAALTSDIEELIGKLANFEGGFSDTGSLDTTAKNVLIRREVARLGHTVNGIEIIDGRVVKLELAGTPNSLFDTGITPEIADGVCHITGQHFGLDLSGKCENRGLAGIILRGELKVEMRHGLHDRSAKPGFAIFQSARNGTAYRIDWMVFEKMISLYESRSCSLYPPL
jgi:hypothetical protein